MKLTGLHIAGIIAGVVIAGIIGYATIEFDGNSEPQVILQENPSIEIHTTDKDLTEKEKTAINFVQNYKGDNNQGDTVAYVIGQVISSQYSDEIIYDTNTKLGWGAYADPDDPNLYGVTFDFKSINDEFSFLWYVDLQNNVIYDASGGAAEILNIVNSD